MILSECMELEPQLDLLVRSGWYGDARNAAGICRQHGLISQEAFDKINRALAGKPVTAHPGHELYGCAVGFDSDTVFSSLQFKRLTSKEDMKKAFKQAVNKIEIETSTQCNRHCSYCPNSAPELAHRRENNAFFDINLFQRLLLDLKEIDYNGKISLVGMNEFFMHDENFEYLELAKRMLPKTIVAAYSNADYLDFDKLERAERAGLDLLVISFHLQAGKPYNVDDVLSRAMKFTERTKVRLTMSDYSKDRLLHFEARAGRINILAGLVNWAADGHNWGGAVASGKTGAPDGTPCQAPVNVLCLCQNGDFTLCCVVPRERTADNLAHGAVMGNLSDFPSIFHAYASDAMLYWRQHAFSTKRIPPLCQSCSGRNAQGNALNKPLAEHVESQHGYVALPNREPQPLKRAAGG